MKTFQIAGRMALLSLAIIVSFAAPAFANNWQGTWNSSFGELRLMQSGDRLFGDYQERGTIEGRISRDGREARAIFLYTDGRWGTAQWRIANDKISGNWNWSQDGLPDPKANSWTGTRSSAGAPVLRYANQASVAYPRRDGVFDRSILQNWLSFSDRPNPAPAPQPAPNPKPNPQVDARDGLGLWYGGYALRGINPAFDIGVDIIHFDGARFGAVDMNFYVNRGRACPEQMHTAFCDELEGLADIGGRITAEVTGNTVVHGSLSQSMWITFKLPGDREDRLLVIGREATYFLASIHHPRRGYDYSGTAQGRSHLCEQTRCSNDIFIDLRKNPARYRGEDAAGRSNRMYNLPNRIAQSHNAGIRPAPMPTPQPAPSPSPSPRNQLSDAYAILDETSDNLGTISFVGNGNRLRANGTLNGFFETGTPHETDYRFLNSTGEAVAFAVTTFAGQSGEQRTGQLIIELPSFARDNPRGTLIMDQDIFLVELVRPIRGLEPEDTGDLPAIGVYGPSYSLRDVPPNRTIVLRQNADRSAPEIGRLYPDARDLNVLQCAPEISTESFERADLNGKKALLSGSWCQVSNSDFAGWLPGRYLSPQTN